MDFLFFRKANTREGDTLFSKLPHLRSPPRISQYGSVGLLDGIRDCVLAADRDGELHHAYLAPDCGLRVILIVSGFVAACAPTSNRLNAATSFRTA